MINRDSSDMLQLICFKFGNKLFGIDILNVKAIINKVCLFSIPHSSEFVEGAIIIVEDTVPVLNLKTILKFSDINYADSSQIIVLEFQGTKFGILVDEINEVLRISVNSMGRSPELIEGVESRFIKATGKYKNRFLSLLNIDEILPGEIISG
jgi:purine-binding chemotaxis protein CheW